MTKQGIRDQFPDASERTVMREFVRRCHGEELADAAFGPNGTWPCSQT